jgi:hypothetical protein
MLRHSLQVSHELNKKPPAAAADAVIAAFGCSEICSLSASRQTQMFCADESELFKPQL